MSTGSINDPDDVADAGADLDAWLASALPGQERQVGELEQLRNEARTAATRPIEMFPFTDGGDGDRFASRFVDTVLCDAVTPKQRLWYIVDPDTNRWKQSQFGEITRRSRSIIEEMRDRAEELESDSDAVKQQLGDNLQAYARRIDTISKYVSMAVIGCESHGMMVDAEAHFDVRHDVIAAGDTLIELQPDGVATRPVEVSDMVTMSTSVRYDPDILDHPPDLIKQYFDTFVPDPHRERMIFKLLGAALLGGNKNRLFHIFQGPSTTGKSQLMEAIDEALGDYSGTAGGSIFRDNLESGGRPDIINLMGKRVALLNEASERWTLHGDRVKDLTGGGIITARLLYSNKIIGRKPTFTPFVLTNKMPRITDADTGVKRRLLIVRFDRSLPPGMVEDPDVKAKFVADQRVLEWLLARVVQGYVDSAREGLSDALAAFALDTAEAFEGLTNAGPFIKWMEESGYLRKVPLEEQGKYGVKSSYPLMDSLYEWYRFWVERRGAARDKRQVLEYADFNNDLKSNHGWETCKSGGHRWVGIQLASAIPAMAVGGARFDSDADGSPA